MPCTACQLWNLRLIDSEIALHVEGVDDPHMPPVLVFPQLIIGLDCGFLQGRIERDDLALLKPREDEARTPTSETARS